MNLKEFREMTPEDQLNLVKTDPNTVSKMMTDSALSNGEMQVIQLMLAIEADDATIGRTFRQLWPRIHNRIKLGDFFAMLTKDHHERAHQAPTGIDPLF